MNFSVESSPNNCKECPFIMDILDLSKPLRKVPFDWYCSILSEILEDPSTLYEECPLQEMKRNNLEQKQQCFNTFNVRVTRDHTIFTDKDNQHCSKNCKYLQWINQGIHYKRGVCSLFVLPLKYTRLKKFLRCKQCKENSIEDLD